MPKFSYVKATCTVNNAQIHVFLKRITALDTALFCLHYFQAKNVKNNLKRNEIDKKYNSNNRGIQKIE